MPIKLNTPASEVDTSDPKFAPMLENLQANILKPHGRDNARHVFLRFTAPASAVKGWIRSTLMPMITTAENQLSTAPDTDGGLVTTFFLSAQGYRHLGFKTSGFASGTFRDGMKHQKDSLFDPLFDRDNKDPEPKKWEPGFQQEIHALIALADDRIG
ncbi:MAG TPA: hypothetical protein VFR81_24790, partial [Longimicrobium sp.]|nr:hypothetical protein [Longimicrobium sp.]